MDSSKRPESQEEENRLSQEAEAALEAAIARSNAANVARLIGYSASAISQVRKGQYKGNVRAVEQAIRGALLNQTIRCPVLGEIKAHICLEHQNRPQKFAMVNAQYIKLFRACRVCPFSNHVKQETEE